jgi:outer membrane protein TolC
MKLIRFLLSLTVLILSFNGLSHSQTDLSLEDAVKKGLENNFSIRIARENLKIAANNNSWAAAGRYPTLDLGVNFNNSYKNEPAAGSTTERNKYMFNLASPYVNLRWTLFNGFSIKIAKDKLAYLNGISEGFAAIAVENTVQAIVLAYYKCLLEKEKLAAVEELRKLSKDRYDYILAKKEVGAAGTYDALQTKIAWLDDTSTVLLQQVNVRNALRNLNLVLGEPAGKEYNLTGAFTVEMHDYQLQDLLDKLLASNKTLKNQYVNQAILKKDIALQRSAMYPSVSLNSGVNRPGSRVKYADTPAVTSTSYDYYVNVSIGFNLFNGGNTRRAIANAKIQHKIGELEIKEMEFALGNFLRTTYEMYNVRKQLYTVAEERIKSARLNMDISGEKFKAGAINSFNYRDVQLIYLNAALGRLRAIYDLIDSHSELMRLTGGVVSEY